MQPIGEILKRMVETGYYSFLKGFVKGSTKSVKKAIKKERKHARRNK